MQHYATARLRKKMTRKFNREIFESVIFSDNFEKATEIRKTKNLL